MNNRSPPDLTEQVAAAFDWWREAGVDGQFHDAPSDWLAAPEAPLAGPGLREHAALAPDTGSPPGRDPGPARNVPIIDSAALPDTLAAFVQWWLEAPALDEGRTTGRVAPRGDAGADLMVLVPEPERDDETALLSGPQGRLLGAMLEAMAIPMNRVYLASVLPRHTPMADWAGLQAGGLAAVALHHVLLARPSRLIVFGSHILPLVSHDPAQDAAASRRFNHGGLSIPLCAARSLSALLDRPRWKAAFWREWLDWTSGGQPGG